MTIPSNWFESFFHGVTLDLWRKAIPPEHTKAETEFLLKALACGTGAHVLDVPCGNGRLSFELAKRGLHLTGIDIAQEFIDEARATQRQTADSKDLTARVEFICGDMRNIKGEKIYDGAFCFGNSFGFLEYADMERFVRGVANALKPGARFIVNTGMAAESVLPGFEEQSRHEISDMVITIKERYNAEESCVDSEYIFERNGTTESRKAKHWIYTAAEIRRMLERNGFKVTEFYGSLKCGPFKLGSRELFVVSERCTRLCRLT